MRKESIHTFKYQFKFNQALFFISKIDKGKSKKKISQGKNDLAYN